MTTSTLFYVHDPMCSWCWAYRPVRDELESNIPASMRWQNLLGGLAPDSDQPMPEATRSMVMNHWRRIQLELGTTFNFDFWTRCRPRRSTYPACRAVLAARRQDAEEAMIDAIQQAYYLRALNPSDDDTLVRLASELGLDREQFAADLAAPATHQALLDEIAGARTMGISRFPSLVLEHEGALTRIAVDYRSAGTTLEALKSVAHD